MCPTSTVTRKSRGSLAMLKGSLLVMSSSDDGQGPLLAGSSRSRHCMLMTAELFIAVTTSSVTTKWPANTSTLGQSRQNPY